MNKFKRHRVQKESPIRLPEEVKRAIGKVLPGSDGPRSAEETSENKENGMEGLYLKLAQGKEGSDGLNFRKPQTLRLLRYETWELG